jgi:hypothetical protein
VRVFYADSTAVHTIQSLQGLKEILTTYPSWVSVQVFRLPAPDLPSPDPVPADRRGQDNATGLRTALQRLQSLDAKDTPHRPDSPGPAAGR